MDTGQVLRAVAPVVASLLLAATAHAENFSMPTGGRTSQPVGHYEFCQRLPSECREMTPKEAPITLTRKLWAELIRVNNTVNQRVKPMTDQQNYGVEEYWSYPDDGYGDCEDYALEKRRKLIADNIPAGDLLMTVVKQPNGDGHAVLTVRTSMGDYILDNLEPRILAWTDTDYRYLKRQSETNSGQWVAIRDDRDITVVGSLK
ncbi:MAG: transglutaminase [Rhizobiaceae bacterium]|nr:MAG: transglutaminase [Rhizobiaceae bacterium]